MTFRLGIRFVLLFLFVASTPACDEPAAIGTAASYETASCLEISDDFIAAMATLDRSCDVASDCVTLGAQEPRYYCDGYPSISDHAGTSASRSSFEATSHRAAIERMLEEWSERCAGKKELCGGPDGIACAWDSGGTGTSCTDHVCTAGSESCL